MKIQALRPDLQEYLKVHDLEKKWQKAKVFFEEDMQHPSLSVKLLKPHQHGIYSFRLDRKYRALFFLNKGEVEVFQITNHY